MSAEDSADIFLEAVEIATAMARSLGCTPAEVAKRTRSRSWIFGKLRKRLDQLGVDEPTLREIVDSLAKAKLSEEIPELNPGQRHRGVREDGYEESIDPVWEQRARYFAEVTYIPRSMFELQGLASRLWGWALSFVENVVIVAERLELIEYFEPPLWRRAQSEIADMKQKKTPKIREITVTRMLAVPIPETEQLKLVRARGELLERKRAIEEEANAQAREFRTRVRELDAQLERNDATVRRGYDLKPISCREKMNFDDAVLEVLRLDTLEIVETRPLTDDERQLTLDDASSPVAAVG